MRGVGGGERREHGKVLGTMRERVKGCRENLKCFEQMKV